MMVRKISRTRRRYKTDQSAAQPSEPAAQAEQSGVYARGQTVIPKTIREAVGIVYGTRLHWELREGVIHVIPIPQRPARALRGILKGTGMTFQWFMQERQRERQLEREQERTWEHKDIGRLGKAKRAPRSS